MHEHVEILPKYMLKCHLGPTQTQWDTAQSRKFENFTRNQVFANPFKHNPTLEILESKA